MADDIKRLNYFTGQFLDAQDFRDEQAYHKEMRWRRNRVLYTSGVLAGLEVSRDANGTSITVNPGVALDDQGREVVILQPSSGPLPSRPLPGGLSGRVNVVVTYEEALTDSHSVGGYTGATRVTESAAVDVLASAPAASQIVLAALDLDASGAITAVDLTVAQKSSILVAGRAGIGTLSPRMSLDVVGGAMISDGTDYAGSNGRMQKGSLALGSISASFGGGSGWNSNMAGLLLETVSDTEIAVHDSGNRVASLLYYQGDDSNRITIGRDMGWGPIGQIVAIGALQAANSDIYFTNADHIHTGFGNANGFAAIENAADHQALMILGRSQSPVPGNAAASRRRVVRLWDFLEVNGDSNITGSVGIGTLVPQARLHVKGEAGIFNLEGSTSVHMQFYPKGFAAGRKAYVGFGDTSDGLTIQNETNAGPVHIFGNGLLYLLNKSGVRVGKEWGGNGRLAVAGDFVAEAGGLVQGTLSVGTQILSPAISVSGAISANSVICSGNLSYNGTQSRLNVGPNDGFATVQAHDLWFGHPTRRGAPGRALVDLGDTLHINYDRDWPNVTINGTVRTPSSRRLKEDICALSSDVARRIVSALEPVSFSFKSDDGKSQCLGFVAEDAPPEVAADNGETIVMNHIVAALAKVVKDQQRVIESLESRLHRLEDATGSLS